MPELLNQPVVQFAAAPFIIAFFVAVLGRAVRLSGLALAAGFAISVWLVMGVRLLPLNAPRLIILVTLAACAAGLLLDFINAHASRTRYLIAGAAAVLVVWLVFPALSQRDPFSAWAAGIGLALYCALVATGMDFLHGRPINAAVAAFSLSLGIGAAAIIGASPLLGNLGFAVSAASAAVVIVQMLTGRPWTIGRAFTLPAAMFAGLAGAEVVTFGKLPWYCLVPFAGVPLLAGTAIAQHQTVWIRAMMLAIATLAFSAAAVFIAWRELGLPPI
ncbi:MAG: hypothetical protein ACKVQU_22070 [Burkholderiales bacterium]